MTPQQSPSSGPFSGHYGQTSQLPKKLPQPCDAVASQKCSPEHGSTSRSKYRSRPTRDIFARVRQVTVERGRSIVSLTRFLSSILVSLPAPASNLRSFCNPRFFLPEFQNCCTYDQQCRTQ